MLLSKRIKIACLCYLRFDRQMPLVATEAGYWNGDVVGVSPTEAVELEIKVSKSDLLADMKTKKAKHSLYLDPDGTTVHVPNKFYFVVPAELEAETIKYVHENANKYGVIVFRERKEKRTSGHKSEQASGWVKIAKKAYRLHNERPHPAFMDQVLARSSSELCRLYVDWEQLMDSQKEGKENGED